MKAIVSDGGFGTRFEDVPDPLPRDDEILVEVQATSINRADLLIASKQPRGTQLGIDFVGTVLTTAADGSGPARGQRVVGLAKNNSWSEVVAVSTDRVATLPGELDAPAGAVLPVAGLTALYALERAGSLLGRSLLVTGANGGVGHLAVQLAAASGADVIAQIRENGRQFALDELPDASRISIEAADSAGAAPIDVLLDSVGGAVTAGAFARIRKGGNAVFFGNTVREDLHLRPDWGHARPGVRIEWLYLLDEITRRDVPADLSVLVRLAETRRLRPHIGGSFAWSDIDKALRSILDREVGGKVVLTL
ncbi:zinc-binding dehydrogenase [Rhodococcoides kyotonense]|uniref:NADPH:quinone reductase n=1 Tax=Rhodococcoides kyotonense TaxID=398843 RepID=A0A239MDA8_9NOCA|nr:zinc-binding dehydrogenase [Rhodococcus kyotonensis]SNT39958.1 NADPH:quinone reductase [Rhodococcus kyotonensis]